VLSIYLAISRQESLCGRKRILKSDFLKTEKRAVCRFPFIGALDVPYLPAKERVEKKVASQP